MAEPTLWTLVFIRGTLLTVLVLRFLMNLTISFQQRMRVENSHPLEEELRGTEYSPEDLRRIRTYTLEKLKLRLRRTIINTTLGVVLILTDGFTWMWKLSGLMSSITIHSVTEVTSTSTDKDIEGSEGGHPSSIESKLMEFYFMLLLVLIISLSHFHLQSQNFKTKKRYGLIRKSHKTWVIEYIGTSVTLVVVGWFMMKFINFKLEMLKDLIFKGSWGLLSLILVASTIVAGGLVCLTLALYVTAIPPGDLKSRLEALADRVGFPKEHVVFSRPTTPEDEDIPNAYFFKYLFMERIVVSPSLILQDAPVVAEVVQNRPKGLTNAQIEAAVAHELGHFAFWHYQSFPDLVFQVMAGLLEPVKHYVSIAVTIWLMESDFWYRVLGLKDKVPLIEVIAGDLLILDHFELLVDVIKLYFNRWAETWADAYAVRLGYGDELEGALVKLSLDNYSYPDSDWWYTVLYLTHPPLIQRLRDIRIRRT